MKRLFRHSLRTTGSLVLAGVVTAVVGYFLVVPQSAATFTTFTVNTTLDLPDINPGDGFCNTNVATCSLRAAITESNYLGGANVITVPSGTYTLTLGPADDEFNAAGATMDSGDLDIMDLGLFFGSTLTSVTINGDGAGVTIIDGDGIDRVLDINNFAASGKSVDVTLNGLTIRNGNAPTSPDGYNTPGGGIQFDGFDNQVFVPTGTLTINDCNITNNTAAGQGGGILAIFGSLDMDGSEVSGNTSVNASGGGISYDGSSFAGLRTLAVTTSRIHNNHANNGTFGNGGGVIAGGNATKSIDHSVITSNTAGTRGGGVFNSSGSLALNFNVIVGNTAPANPLSSGLHNNTGPISADNNWWGCNQGPGFSPCDRVSGPLGAGIAGWLTLSHTASPNTIVANDSTTLQADFFTNNLGTGISAADLVALNGRAVVFNNAVLGTISGADPTINAGKANATFTAGPTGGSGSADATVDHATVTALITIAEAPIVGTNPSDQTVCDGGTATFTASSSGVPAPTVQWQVSTGGPFTDIAGATNTTLMFTATAADNGNQYRAVFTNSGGTATTTAATLTVNTAPAVTANPVNATVCEGDTATFTAAGNGSPAPTVQWQVSTGGPFSNIAGATSTTLSFTASASENGNSYRAVFTNECGSATTTAATLTVNAATTASTPTDQTVCQGATASFSTTASGTGPFSYAWTVDGSPFGGDTSSINVPTGSLSIGSHPVSVTVSGACGSVVRNATLTVQAPAATTDPTDATVCQGATASFLTTASGTGPFSYAWTVDGSPFGGDTSSINVPTGSLSVGSHTVSVTTTGACGSASQSASLTVQENTATTDPGDATVCQGATASFLTTASGTGPFSYAWTVDGSPFGGDTSSINVPTGSLSVGSHTVSVTTTGACGSASQSASLTVQENTATTDPGDATVCQGATASFSTTASGTGPFSYAWTVDGSPFGGDTSSINVPTGSLSVGSHTITVTTTGGCGSASQSASLTVQENTATTDPGDATVCQGATASFSTTASGTGPFSYAWTVDGSPFGGDTSSINVPTGSLSVGSHTVSVTTTGACGSASQSASLTVQENTATTDPGDATVCQGATASFSTTASGTGPFSYAWTVDGSPFGGDTSSINVPTGSLSVGSHTITVTTTGGCGSASQSATLTVQQPTGTTDPADVTVCKGATANFSTTASGTGPFHYAWTLDGLPFNGDSSSISVPTGSLSSGPHTVTVTTSGSCGSATQTAILTVGDPPVITLSTSTVSMWPPNHNYQTFNVSDFVASASGCDGDLTSSVVIANVTSDEPEDNLLGADGTTLNDIDIAPDCKSVQLRAERDGDGNGRVYTITFKVSDSQGNTTTATATVTVPVNQSGPAAVNGPGPGYSVNSLCP